MPNNIQTTQTGAAELKDYYDMYGSTYEAIKRRRKKRMKDQGLELSDETSVDPVPNPDL